MRQERPEEVVDRRDTHQLGRQRPRHGVGLEEHQMWSECAPSSQDVVDHVVSSDLAKDAGQEVVVDPLGCQPVTRSTPRAGPQPLEPDHLPMSGGMELRSSGSGGVRHLGRRRHEHLVALGDHGPHQRGHRIEVSRTGDRDNQDLQHAGHCAGPRRARERNGMPVESQWCGRQEAESRPAAGRP